MTLGGTGQSYSGPGFGSSAFWTPNSVGDYISWSGTADAFLNDGELLWLTSQITQGGAVYAWLEPAKRVGDYLHVELVSAAPVDVPAIETGGGDGFLMGSFKVVSHSVPATFSVLYLTANGTGDDSTAFSEIGLFVDVNDNGVYDPGVDQRFGQAHSAYPADNGALTFNETANPVNIAANSEVTMLVVAKLNGPVLAGFGETFNTIVAGIGATGYAHTGMPTAAIPGCTIVSSQQIRVLHNGTLVSNGAADNLGNVTLPDFDVTYTIMNTGTATLNLTGNPVITAGTNVASATLLTPPAATVAGGWTTTFTIRCTPVTEGPLDFTVTIDSDSEQDATFTWTATANAINPPPNKDKGGNDSGSCSSQQGGPMLPLLAAGALILFASRRRAWVTRP